MDYQSVTPSDYSAYCVAVPADSRLPGSLTGHDNYNRTFGSVWLQPTQILDARLAGPASNSTSKRRETCVK